MFCYIKNKLLVGVWLAMGIKRKQISESIESSGFFRKHWWVLLICFFSYFAYDQVIKQRLAELAEVEHQLSLLEAEKRLAFNEKEDLLLKINSQNDPAWIELMLMQELGVVPEGHIKVHFTNE